MRYSDQIAADQELLLYHACCRHLACRDMILVVNVLASHWRTWSVAILWSAMSCHQNQPSTVSCCVQASYLRTDLIILSPFAPNPRLPAAATPLKAIFVKSFMSMLVVRDSFSQLLCQLLFINPLASQLPIKLYK